MDKEKCPLCELGYNMWNWEYKPGVIEENEYNDDFDHEGIHIKDNRLYFDNSGGEYERDFILISYCPICGRKL